MFCFFQRSDEIQEHYSALKKENHVIFIVIILAPHSPPI
jgi:hypothetical protein